MSLSWKTAVSTIAFYKVHLLRCFKMSFFFFISNAVTILCSVYVGNVRFVMISKVYQGGVINSSFLTRMI